MPSTTRHGRSTRAQRREEIRDLLRSAVEELMADGESYTELSVERIVRAAGISRATFYVYFEDKGDLLRALADDFVERMLEAASEWWSLPPDATRADLRTALNAIFDAYRPHKVIAAAVVEVSSYDANLRALFGDLLERVIGAVAAHVETGQEHGFVEPELDPQRTAAWLTWMAERGLYQLVAPAGPAATERLLDALTDIVWNTLYRGTR
jgi:TetR/AcrR family transcriptional regulator, ethionamide resistance regulator